MSSPPAPRDVRIEVLEKNGRRYASTGNRWEKALGYSRAVRVGSRIYVTGTLGVEPDGGFAATAQAQARRAFAIMLGALEALGGKAADIIWVRGYITDIDDLDAVGLVFAEMISGPAGISPCLTQVAVAALADPRAKVELEMEAEVSK
jgi:enamine deaminase RidA (YjgF/YER057c/UK114 family)